MRRSSGWGAKTGWTHCARPGVPPAFLGRAILAPMHAPAVRLHLFGSPTVESGGVRTALPLERRTQLVVLLALRRQWVPRAEIAAMLWPEQEDRLAFANLRKTLFRLQALPWAAAIELQGAALRLEMATDVADFESALREQRTGEALAGYRGELLAGFDDNESEAWTRWVGFERDRLRTAWRAAALARLADAAIEPAEAVALSARLLEADPLDEAALRQHMSALARDGQAGAARAAYRQFVERLSTDLGLTPGAELRALHDALTGARPLAAGIGAVAAGPADDGFVGRSAELKRIADLLGRDECRLLCLIGPGGVGKTRLARRTMQELAPRFADGAVFVPLEDVDTAEQLGLRLAREGGVADSGRDEPLARVIESWRDQQMLLVLDNFEQLAAHAGILDRLLQACARLKIVVTSRLQAGGRRRMVDAARGPARPGSGRRGPGRVLRRGAPVRPGGAAGRAELRRGRRDRRDRRRLPSGGGAAAGDRARGRLGADAVVPGHRRRAAPRHRAAARRRHAPPAAPRQHRGGVRALVAAPERYRTGGALAPVRLPRRLLDGGRARGRGCLAAGARRARRQVAAGQGRRPHAPAPAGAAARRPPAGRRWLTRLDRGRPLGAFPPLAAPARAGERERRPRGAAGDRPRLRELPARLPVLDRPEPGRGAEAQPADAAQLLRASRPLRRGPGAVPAGHRIAAGGRPPDARPPAQPGGV